MRISRSDRLHNVTEDLPDLPDHDLQIEPERLLADVLQVVAQLPVGLVAGSVVDLRQPRQPGVDEPPAWPVLNAAQYPRPAPAARGGARPRSYHPPESTTAAGSHQDAPDFPHPRHAGVHAAGVLLGEFHAGFGLGVRHHAPELVDGERLSELCCPVLTVQHRPQGVEFDRDRDDRDHWRQDE